MKTAKKGDVGELKFMLEATKRGYQVSAPYGVCEGYDFILDNGDVLFKVQVKSALRKERKDYNGSYVEFGDSGETAESKGADILVCYNASDDLFYLFPEAVLNSFRVRIFDGNTPSNNKYAPYRELWSVFEPTVNKVPYTVKVVDGSDE